MILGIFAADLAFRADRLPQIGETILASGFDLGPGGKGSNQAVAARRAGAAVSLITRVGDDAFGTMARDMWAREGIDTSAVTLSARPTGAAFIFVQSGTGDNAIIVESGAAAELSAADLDKAAQGIATAWVFMTQLEQPLPAARRGLEIARGQGVVTILNPAPAAALEDAIYPLCDYLTPNETEASALAGVSVTDLDSARRAGDVLLRRGVGCALITLGDKGALFHARDGSDLIPPFPVAAVMDTTGAGDAFNGGFAAALAAGVAPRDAARFGCATAALSVTRPGTAAAMPQREEILALFASQGAGDGR